MDRATILSTAAEYVTKDRDAQYGSAEDNFTLIGNLWNTYLVGKRINYVDAHDVAVMMALLKVARIATGQPKADNYIDLAGYIACAGEIACKEKTPVGTIIKVDQKDYDAACARARRETLK